MAEASAVKVCAYETYHLIVMTAQFIVEYCLNSCLKPVTLRHVFFSIESLRTAIILISNSLSHSYWQCQSMQLPVMGCMCVCVQVYTYVCPMANSTGRLHTGKPGKACSGWSFRLDSSESYSELEIIPGPVLNFRVAHIVIYYNGRKNPKNWLSICVIDIRNT